MLPLLLMWGNWVCQEFLVHKRILDHFLQTEKENLEENEKPLVLIGFHWETVGYIQQWLARTFREIYWIQGLTLMLQLYSIVFLKLEGRQGNHSKRSWHLPWSRNDWHGQISVGHGNWWLEEGGFQWWITFFLSKVTEQVLSNEAVLNLWGWSIFNISSVTDVKGLALLCFPYFQVCTSVFSHWTDLFM
jgi:hypothetical protein